MLALALSLLLAADPARTPVEDYLAKACPPPKQEADNNVELKEQAGNEARCAKKAMDKDLDRVLVPLKKKADASFPKWMALQARYNKWMDDVCNATEELDWVDLRTRMRSDGTARGFTLLGCKTKLASERGYFASMMASGDMKAARRRIDAASKDGETQRARVNTLVSALEQAKAQPTAKADPDEPGEQPYSQKEFDTLIGQVKRARDGAADLARDQCALVPGLGEGCAVAVERYLLSLAALGMPEER